MSDDLHAIRRERRALRIYAAATTVISSLALLGAARAVQRSATFDSITVHKLVLADSDGTTRLVIANRQNYPPPVIRGKLLDPKQRHVSEAPVIMFYNRDGSEQGGLTWNGAHDANGGFQSAALTLDQLEENDNLILAYGERNGVHHAGLYGREQSQTTPLPDVAAAMNTAIARGRTAAEKDSIRKAFIAEHFEGNDRFSIGYASDGAAVRLADPEGRTRLVMMVDSTGHPKIQFLDEHGRVTREVTDAVTTSRRAP